MVLDWLRTLGRGIVTATPAENHVRQLKPFGWLKEDPNIPGEWYSDPVPVPLCSGRSIRFYIRTGTDGDCYPPDVQEAVRLFLALTDSQPVIDRVYQYYLAFVALIPDADLGVPTATELWGRVRPSTAFVDRHQDGDGRAYVRLACACDWDEEHGLQILFRDGTDVTLVGEHDDGQFEAGQ
jgi:hypothetical protein